MKLSGAQALIQSLEKHDVEVIFGYPGAAVVEIYDELLKSPIRHVLVRHESSAANAASGYARTTGKVGVCMATSGPGATNLITGITNAYMDSTPIVAITGQVTTDKIGTDAFQEVDITGATAPFTKHNYLVKKASDIPRIMAEAFYIASTGRPGPVLVDIPRDISQTVCSMEFPETVQMISYKPNIKGHHGQIKRVVEALNDSKNPMIIAGGGMLLSGAWEELLELTKKSGVAVATTMMGTGSFPSNSSQYVGMLGASGKKDAESALHQADFVMILGARLADRGIGAITSRNRPIMAQIDVDPAEIGKNMIIDIPVVGDIKHSLKEILKRDIVKRKLWFKKSENKPLSDEGLIEPAYLFQKLAEVVDDGDVIIASDVGQNQLFLATKYPFTRPRSHLASGGLGTMGFGMPAAMGAAIGNPDKTVMAVVGDGGFMMSLGELATLVQHDVPVKIILMNNGELGLVRELQDIGMGGRHSGICLDGNPDFMILCKAFGIQAKRIKEKAEAKEAFTWLLNTEGAALLEVMLPPNLMTSGKGE